MSQPRKVPHKPGRSHVPVSALAKAIKLDESMIHVHLTDGRIISAPLAWFPTLLHATPRQRLKHEIGGGGIGLHWPDLDEDLLWRVSWRASISDPANASMSVP